MRKSSQRTAILEVLRNTDTHPTADWIYMQLKPRMPNLSLGTVYRNLRQLTEAGEILRVGIEGGVDRFDGTASPHYHFFCSECGRVTDLPLDYQPELNASVQRQGYLVKGHEIHFFGVCDECMKKKS